jgi:signal peptidase
VDDVNVPEFGMRAAHIVGLLVLVAAVSPFVVYAVPQTVGADQSFVVVSGSMEPTLAPGDVVLVEETPNSEIQQGDVITFTQEADQQPITHRVVEVRETDGERAFVTKGDANEDRDSGVVRPSNVLGVVNHDIPLIGHVIMFGNSATGAFVLVGVPILLLLVSEAIAFARSNSDSSADGDDSDSSAPTATVASPDQTKETDDDGITITKTDLRGTLGVLFVSTVYAGIVLYIVQSAWAVTGFVAGLGMLLLGGAAAHAAPEASDNAADVDTTQVISDGALHVSEAEPPEDATKAHAVEVESLSSFLELARVSDRPVHWDGESYVLPLDETTIFHDTDHATGDVLDGDGLE